MENQELILEKICQIEKIVHGNFTDRPLTIEEASQFLGLTKSYLYKLTSNKQIPHYKPFGKRLYFETDELKSWIYKHPISAEVMDEVGINNAESSEEQALKYVSQNPTSFG